MALGTVLEVARAAATLIAALTVDAFRVLSTDHYPNSALVHI